MTAQTEKCKLYYLICASIYSRFLNILLSQSRWHGWILSQPVYLYHGYGGGEEIFEWQSNSLHQSKCIGNLPVQMFPLHLPTKFKCKIFFSEDGHIGPPLSLRCSNIESLSLTDPHISKLLNKDINWVSFPKVYPPECLVLLMFLSVMGGEKLTEAEMERQRLYELNWSRGNWG